MPRLSCELSNSSFDTTHHFNLYTTNHGTHLTEFYAELFFSEALVFLNYIYIKHLIEHNIFSWFK